MIKIECPSCKFSIHLDNEEAIYESYLFCLCDNLFKNPNFIGEIELKVYLRRKNG